MNPKRDQCRFGLETLEPRRLLAGVVSANVWGVTLTLTGDSADNAVLISQDETGMSVSGLDGTELVGADDFSRVRSIVVRLGDGDDALSVDGVSAWRIAVENRTDQIDVSMTSVNSNVVQVQHFGDAGGSLVVDGDSELRWLRHVSVSGVMDTTIRGNTEIVGTTQVTTSNGDSHVVVLDDADLGRFVGSGVSIDRNVVYASPDETTLHADVYTPNLPGPHPAVILVHGGGWRSGNKYSMAYEARALADRGYVAIAINYRLAPTNPYPAQIEDVHSAVAWARANAAEFQIQSDAIGLFGFSAGAHLTLLAGVQPPTPETQVSAVVAGAPRVDFESVDPDDSRFEFLFGGTRDELPGLYQDASPNAWLTPDDPATLLFYGDRDFVIDQAEIDAFHARAVNLGHDMTLQIVPNRNHLSSIADTRMRSDVIRFFDEQLKSSPLD